MTEFEWMIAGAAKMTDCRMESRKKKVILQEDALGNLLKKLCAQPDIPPLSLGDFRRSDTTTKTYLLTAILAVLDAGLPAGNNTAVIDCSRSGCLAQNQTYLADYVQYGRVFGRGHLFVGTLPSTPVCETAITFGYHGAVYYTNTLDDLSLYGQEIELLLQDHPAVLAFYHQGKTLYAFCMVGGNTIFPGDPNPEELFSGGQNT